MSINPFNPIKVNPFNPFTPSTDLKTVDGPLYTPYPKNNPLPKESPVSSLLQPNKNVVSPFSFATNQQKSEPLKWEAPAVIQDVVNNQKQNYQEQTKAFQGWESKQKELTSPVVEAIRKPIVSAIDAGKVVKDAPLQIMNHPVVKDNMVEVAKRTSGTGIVSMIQAVGPKTFEEAYSANRQAQAGDPSVLNKFLYQLGDSLPQTAIGVALNFVPYAGRPLSASYWTALSASEQIESGGKVESLRPIAIDVLGDSMLGKSIESLFKAPAKTLFQTIKKNFLVEGGTEVAQDLLKFQDAYLRAKTPQEKAAILQKAKEYFTSGQILITLGVGGISGAGIGTASYLLNQSPMMSEKVISEEQAGGVNPPPPPPPGGPGASSVVQREQRADYVAELNALQRHPNPEIAQKAMDLYSDIQNMSPLDRQSNARSMVEYIKTLAPVSEPSQPVDTPVISGRQQKEVEQKTLFNNALPMNKGLGYKKFARTLDGFVKNKTILPEDAVILKTVFEGTNDEFLGRLNMQDSARLTRALGNFSVKSSRLTGKIDPTSNRLKLQRGIAKQGFDAGRVFTHEYGHAGWYLVLSPEEREMVTGVYKSLGKGGSKALFEQGLGGNVNYHAKNVQEFFAESFAEYIWENKVPAAQMKPLLQRIALKFYEGLRRLVNRGQIAAINRIRPVFEKILSGEKDTPLNIFYDREPPSFKQELQQLFEQRETQGPVEPAIESLPPDIGEVVEPPQKVKEGQKRTPVGLKIGWLEKLSTPFYVLQKLGLRENYQELKQAHFEMYKESKSVREKLISWMKEVPGQESNEKIFNYLDGQKVELSPTEMKVAQEIKVWLENWADRLQLPHEERITNYITHIFPKDDAAEIPEEIAVLIRDKIPGEVYNPFLLERMGAEGYVKDTWRALEAYGKRGVRKVHMDPALENLKEATSKLSEDSQIQYVQDFIHNVNMRPTKADVVNDNTIKKIFGSKLGARPTRAITLGLRKMISGAKIAGSLVTFAKNLTQGVNTFSQLGTKYTLIGYINLFKKGAGQELENNGVLLSSVAEDQIHSAVRKWAEAYDKVLYANMNASEFINRGAAYFGAKAQFMAGKVSDKEFKQAFGQDKPEGYVPSEQDAIDYGKFMAEKTQFVFGALDNPVLLNSDMMKTAFQFQTFTLKQQEYLIRMIGDKEWGKLARYIMSSMLLFAYIGGAFGMKWSDSFPFFKLGKPPFIQFLYDDLFKQGILGEDQYGNKLDTMDKVQVVGKSLFTNVVPMGAQLNRSYEGFNAVNAGKSTTRGGSFQYKIEKTPMNYVRGTLFGKSNLTEAKEYYKNKDSKKTKTKTVNSFNAI
jgi:hypothetical protein